MTTRGTTFPIVTVIGAICVWCAGLSTTAYSQFGTTSSLTASVGDIKETIDNTDLPQLKAEVDFLAAQRGYKLLPLPTSTITTNVQY